MFIFSLIWFESSTVDAPLFAYIPIPTVFKLAAFFLWALNKVFSETGPSSTFAMSERVVTLSLFFLRGSCLIVSMLE